jgi:GNAT superfamily N-acetyltransferase
MKAAAINLASASTVYLGMLTVAPSHQTCGIGKEILRHAEEIAQGWQSPGMRMTVLHQREELIRYYERRGYRKTEAWEPFPGHDPRFGIPKVQDLKFLELVKEFPTSP